MRLAWLYGLQTHANIKQTPFDQCKKFYYREKLDMHQNALIKQTNKVNKLDS